MLKPLLLSGWFGAQPFLKYVVVAILIAPLVAASGHSSSAKQSKAMPKTGAETKKPDSVAPGTTTISEPSLADNLTARQTNSQTRGLETLQTETKVGQKPELDSLLVKEYSDSHNPLAGVELAPITKSSGDTKLADDQAILQQVSEANLLVANQIASTLKQSQPSSTPEIVVEEPKQDDQTQIDPIGSPHPIPWQWIVATQEAIGSKGGSGTRFYRSVPVVSPDGKYAVYSRVQIEVKPDMYNSRVTSVLFVEERATKKLRVMATTNISHDPLLKRQTESVEQSDGDGKIGVLVPVSWSEKSDRFLARKFQGLFNTGDSTDHAVIWDRHKNQTNIVTPVQTENDHEKIAVLLGWSKNEPDHVIFRAGELGEENWPLVKVAVDGKTAVTTDSDQPITYGDKLTQVWAGPQVATR